LRNDNGYKHCKPEVRNTTESTPLHKDWRLWAGGVLALTVCGVVYYIFLGPAIPQGPFIDGEGLFNLIEEENFNFLMRMIRHLF
jgi:hypothetical protein